MHPGCSNWLKIGSDSDDFGVHSCRAILALKILPNPALVNHFGSRLIAQGALPQAVRLYQWAGDAESIAREVCRQATNLLDLGQWETLRGWIDQLPASALEA